MSSHPGAAPAPPEPPRYGVDTLSDLLPSVLAALGVPGTADPRGRIADRLGLATGPLAGVRKVALLVLDGLGARLLPVAVPHAPALADLAAGRLGAPARTLTAGFPSTTPVSLVSLGTGTPPGRHGVLGFSVRIPGTVRVLNHIRWRDDPDPLRWQPVPPLFGAASSAGVAVSTVNRPEFVGAGLTTAIVGDLTYRGATGVDALADGLLAELSGDGPVLVYGYHNQPDKAGHEYGVGSPEWVRELSGVDRLLDRLVTGLPPDAALLVTADHGQINVPADRRIDVADHPELLAGVRVLAGEPRVRYLHPRRGATGDVLDAWRGVLGDAAWVVTRTEAIEGGWFGPVPVGHRERIGEIVVACRGHGAVFATGYEPPGMLRLVGLHGSFTPAEMEIPLLVARP